MKRLLSVCCALLLGGAAQAKPIEVASPDGRLRLTVEVTDRIDYTLRDGDDAVLGGEGLALRLADRTLGERPRLRRVSRSSADELLQRINPTKNAGVRNRYNAVRLDFAGGYALEFRLFDEGAAYRFVTSLPGGIDVMEERVRFTLPSGSEAWLSEVGGFNSMYEEPYTLRQLSAFGPDGRMTYLPVLTAEPSGRKVLLAESDLRDYPCMFLRGDGRGGFTATFPRVPKEYGPKNDRSLEILSEETYIARTEGARTFPWRVAAVAREDADLVRQELVWLLAEPAAERDWSWVQPGLVSWDWWNGMRLTGVDFRAGRNTESYRRYIDFAAEYGIPYIIMDEGWSASTTDVFRPNPNLDLEELVAYGGQRGVRIILWLTWLAVERDMERLFGQLEEWGIAGVKIDFMDRSDQWMVNYYERVAAEAARHRMVVAFHGAFKPAGLEYKYPNVLAYEGVRGMENMGGCTPANSLWLPFIRNAVGPMDYTPGAMISMQPEAYCGNRPNAASIGTRAYQMALFVLFETGLQMLADNPTLYYREEECTRFISQVPVTWDETRALRAEAGKHVVVAKRKGAKWYLGAIRAGDDPQDAEFEIPLDFLAGDRDYRMTSFEDGINAFRQAMDYRKKERQVRRGDTIAVRMARNGGWTAVIE